MEWWCNESIRSVGERVKQSKAKSKQKPKKRQKSKRKARKKAAPRKARDGPALIGSWPEGVPHLACLIGLSQVAFPPRYLTLFILFSVSVLLYFEDRSGTVLWIIHRKETSGLRSHQKEGWKSDVEESGEKRGDGQPGIRPSRFCLMTTVKILPLHSALSLTHISTRQGVTQPSNVNAN
ncbi:uncharacterized protein BO96DRAFT_119750 [Aspergillus niger CBS 101883]|uniref:uncharacterized protein n=1 Tax=Aspergillus lacticoffeatus (strain CBS 101883) TaxID=1450533 RepID=UPI000D8007FE|nr:uncharacterized protein BO96DRAFT_119750 [Aspergillus niger CBS 101883]PYH53828.1 hypothetical protein BO96DRAFT_119750 [Aspergillus niger CBS 101883]